MRLCIRGGPEEGLKALRAPSERQFSQLPGMSVLRPLDKLPGLNTATILVGVSSPDSRAHLSSWAAPQQPGLLRLSEILAWLLRRECGGRESPSLNQSELAALWEVSTNKCAAGSSEFLIGGAAGPRAQGKCRRSKMCFSPCIPVRPAVETRLSQGGCGVGR